MVGGHDDKSWDGMVYTSEHMPGYLSEHMSLVMGTQEKCLSQHMSEIVWLSDYVSGHMSEHMSESMSK